VIFIIIYLINNYNNKKNNVSYITIILYNYCNKVMSTNENSFIVETVIALCHTNSDNIFSKQTNNLMIYLQEFIKYKIINKKFIISNDDKNICLLLCEKLGLNNNYSFIFDIFNVNKIEINNNKIINIIPLFDDINKNTTIKKLLNNWQIKENITLTNIPQFICLNITRNNKIQIDIQKKIKLNTNNNWNFYSALCKHENDYYVLLYKDDEFYIYDYNNELQFYKVKMNDKNVIDMIKYECVFVVYKIM